MTRFRKPSAQTAAVLRALGTDPAGWRYGYDLGRETGLKAGSLYPILMRLTDRGQLEARWEPEPPPGRPARHLYRLTEAGLAMAAQAEPVSVEPVSVEPVSVEPVSVEPVPAPSAVPRAQHRPQRRPQARPQLGGS